MSVSYVASAGDNATLGGNPAPSIAGASTGDLMVAFYQNSGGTLPATPSGWTLDGTGQAVIGTSACVGVYTRTKQAGDGNPVFDTPSTTNGSVTVDFWRGASGVTCSTPTTDATSGSTISFNSLTMADTTSVSSLMLGAASGANSISSVSTGYTSSGSSGGTTLFTASERNMSPGGGTVSPGTTSITTAKTNRFGVHIEILPIRVAQTRQLVWNIAAATTQVAQTRQLVWDLINQVAQTRQLVWNITNQVAQTRQLRWDLINQIAQTRQLRWDLINQVAQTRQLRWDLINQVSNQRVLVWNITNQTFNGRTLVWNIGNPPVSTDVGVIHHLTRRSIVRQGDVPFAR